MTYNDDWGGPPGPRRRTLWGDLAGLWRGFRSRSLGLQLLAAAVVIVVILVLLARGDDGGERVASRATTTLATLPPPTTTTTVALPPGEDGVVRTVLDGDSFELLDGVKIRMIGIDAPDVETDACFAVDATNHLRQLLPAGATVRLVYDETRTDRLDRTLAYVYRVPDGLFVNVAMARDGFAIELRTPPNTLHADAIAAAVADARAANRGLHQICAPTTTTGAGGAATTTTPTAPAATTTTSPAATTTTTDAPATTTTSEAPATTTVAPVQRDVICAPPGATGVFSDGTPAVCAPDTLGFNRWRAA